MYLEPTGYQSDHTNGRQQVGIKMSVCFCVSLWLIFSVLLRLYLIVNIGSGTALMGFTTAQDAYTASKGALISLTRSMAIVYAKDNIRTNIIHPGPVNAPMQKEWNEDTKKEISAWVPLGRLASAEDIAYCGLFLASEESAYITGTEIIVDGGIMVKGR
jgi:NAD(P)-dependent dehydrogenase (short-subunit alcohol dehydrogenase family)